jgi:hypothetical protein
VLTAGPAAAGGTSALCHRRKAGSTSGLSVVTRYTALTEAIPAVSPQYWTT